MNRYKKLTHFIIKEMNFHAFQNCLALTNNFQIRNIKLSNKSLPIVLASLVVAVMTALTKSDQRTDAALDLSEARHYGTSSLSSPSSRSIRCRCWIRSRIGSSTLRRIRTANSASWYFLYWSKYKWFGFFLCNARPLSDTNRTYLNHVEGWMLLLDLYGYQHK